MGRTCHYHKNKEYQKQADGYTVMKTKANFTVIILKTEHADLTLFTQMVHCKHPIENLQNTMLV